MTVNFTSAHQCQSSLGMHTSIACLYMKGQRDILLPLDDDYIGIFKEIIHYLLSRVESFSHFLCKRLCVHKKKHMYHEVEH